MEEVKEVNIESLSQDEHNFNKGTERGGELMERSFKELGAGRSILLDKHGNIIAGNKSQKAAIAAGIKKVRVIETTGDELIAVQRTDIDIDSAEGRKMAYLDNLTTQVNLAWDETELKQVQGEVEDFEVEDFGFDIENLPQVVMPTNENHGAESSQQTPTNSELDVNEFGDKIKMTLEFSIEEHAFVQQSLSVEGLSKEQVLLNLLGYAEG